MGRRAATGAEGRKERGGGEVGEVRWSLVSLWKYVSRYQGVYEMQKGRAVESSRRPRRSVPNM